MNPDPSKLRQQQQQAEEGAQLDLHQQTQAAQEFNSAEEIIRFDAAHTAPPESIAERLKESIALEPPPPQSWWRRLLGKKT